MFHLKTPELTNRTHAWRRMSRAVFGVCMLAVGAAALAQDNGAEYAPLATLPQSNEALVLTNRVSQAIDAGDYRLAIQLIDEIAALPGELVAAPASRTYYPVWRQALVLMGQLPPAGVELYRQLHDAEVAVRFEAACKAADVDELRLLFRKYRVSRVWPQIGDELAAQLIERGRFGDAVEVLRELEWGVDADDVPLSRRLRMIVALERVGARDTAAESMKILESPPPANDADAARVRMLEEWLATDVTRSDTAAADPYRLRGAPAWSDAYSSDGETDWTDSDAELGDAVDRTHRLPLHEPRVADDTLVFRMHGTLWAYDALTLTQRWRVRDLTPNGLRVGIAGGLDAFESDDLNLPADAQLLLTNHLQHTLAVGGGRVYTIEALTLFSGNEPPSPQSFNVQSQVGQRNELVARDLRSGRIVWRTGEDPAHPLFEVEFHDRPLMLGDRLVVPIRRNDDLLLAEINAADGTLRREVSIVGPPTHFTRQGGRALITADETSIYVSTGNGVLAALGRDDLRWKWAMVYPSTVAEHLGRLWWKPAVAPRESGIDRPVLADDLLVVAPVDSLDIIALDRFSGRQRWSIPRRDYAYVIGAVPGGLIVGGAGVSCLDLDDPTGRAVRWRSVPLEITGRPTIYRGCLYTPTRDGLIVLDGRTGKVLDDQIAGDAVAEHGDPSTDPPELAAASAIVESANVTVTDDAVYVVSPTRVVKYPAPAATRARCERLAAKDGQHDRALLAGAWLDALAGQYDSACERLQQISDPRSPLAKARDRLLADVYLALARRTNNSGERLAWLRRAADLTDVPEVAARLAVLIGRALEARHDWPAALAHYGAMLNVDDSRTVAHEPGGQSADWLDAVARLRAILHPASRSDATPTAAETDDFLNTMLADVHCSDAALARLRLAIIDPTQRRRIDRTLLERKLPPELEVNYLPATADDEDASEADRLQLCLARWETFVALDQLDEAADAESAWRRAAADAKSPVPDELLDRVAAIETARDKLVAARGVPFDEDLRRQWRVKDAELLLDPKRLDAPLPRWLLLRDLEHREIHLVNAFRNDVARRKTTDALKEGDPFRGSQLDEYQRALSGQRLRWQETNRTFWPVVEYGSLAAVPVQGGLVAVGLGPERAGGRRLWEFLVPEWLEIPENFNATTAATRYGVCFTPRHDRLVMVGWNDGKLWWQRDFGGLTIRRVLAAGDWLVVVSDDQRVWLVDALFGGRPRPLPVENASLLGVEVVDDAIVAWGAGFVTAFDAATLERRWSRPLDQLGYQGVEAAGRPWLALRVGVTPTWRVIDMRTGEPALAAPLIGFDRITALAMHDGALYAAGFSESGDHAGEPEARIARFDVPSAQREWLTALDTRIAIRTDQLLAHDRLIPVLIHRQIEQDDGDVASPAPSIQLVNREDGSIGSPYSLEGDYRGGPSACDMFLIATPTRIIVQVAGNTIAYGRSNLQSQP